MPLTAYDVKMARSIFALVNPKVKGRFIEYDEENKFISGYVIGRGKVSEGEYERVYTCIYDMSGWQRSLWNDYKTYLRYPSFEKEIEDQRLTLIGWE